MGRLQLHFPKPPPMRGRWPGGALQAVKRRSSRSGDGRSGRSPAPDRTTIIKRYALFSNKHPAAPPPVGERTASYLCSEARATNDAASVRDVVRRSAAQLFCRAEIPKFSAYSTSDAAGARAALR